MDRLPYRATPVPYQNIQRLPVAVLLDNVRSLYNVGAFFRTADAARIEKLYLGGITGRPPKAAITKTALGAETALRGNTAGNRPPKFTIFRRGGTKLPRLKPASTPSICSIGRPIFQSA